MAEKIKVWNTRLRKRKERRETGGGCVETGRLARFEAASAHGSRSLGRHRPASAALGSPRLGSRVNCARRCDAARAYYEPFFARDSPLRARDAGLLIEMHILMTKYNTNIRNIFESFRLIDYEEYSRVRLDLNFASIHTFLITMLYELSKLSNCSFAKIMSRLFAYMNYFTRFWQIDRESTRWNKLDNKYCAHQKNIKFFFIIAYTFKARNV